jgi:PncC family amidohydrolase
MAKSSFEGSALSMNSQFASLLIEVVARLRSRGETLSLAESCTGGLLSSWFTEMAGVSDVFNGAIVAYANQVKIDVLAVSEETLMTSGAVSLLTASEMARGAKLVLKSNWALSITGVAGPGGGSLHKPVGTVCFGICGPTIEGHVVDEAELKRFDGERRVIQEASARHAVEILMRKLAQA